MIPALVTLTLALAQVPAVGGLREGESARRSRAPLPPGTSSDAVFVGRLVEAETGRPVVCARVETWFEDYFDPEHMPPPLALAETGPDGVFVALREGVEKVRITHPGRASTVVVVSDLDGEEFPLFPRRPLEVRAVDLDGRPIEGAWMRTRQTCAHAPTADFARSDDEGRLVLEAFPPLRDLASVEVGAPGYGAFDGLGPRELLWLRARDGAVDVPLPRRAPIELLVLDANGRPARGRVLYGEHPWRTARLDAGGRGRIDDPGPGRDGPMLALLEPVGMEERLWLSSHHLPRDRRAVLRVEADFDADAWDGPTAAVTVYVELDVAVREAPPVWVFDAHGFAARGLGPHVLPRGPVTAVVGGTFGGWREAVATGTASGDELVLHVATAPEPRIEIVPPPGGLARVLVEADGDATVLEDVRGPVRQPVPAGVPVTVVGEGPRGEMRRARLAEAGGGERVDLSAEATVTRRALDVDGWPRASVWIDAIDADGAPLESEIGELVTVEGRDVEIEPTDTGAHRALVPRHTRWAARVAAAGHRPRWILGQTGADDEVWTVTLEREAHVALVGSAWTRAVVGQHLVERDAGAAGVVVSPGRLDLRVELDDGRWVEVYVRVGPGDARTIVLP